MPRLDESTPVIPADSNVLKEGAVLAPSCALITASAAA